jgi:hypothetical protein
MTTTYSPSMPPGVTDWVQSLGLTLQSSSVQDQQASDNLGNVTGKCSGTWVYADGTHTYTVTIEPK